MNECLTTVSHLASIYNVLLLRPRPSIILMAFAKGGSEAQNYTYVASAPPQLTIQL